MAALAIGLFAGILIGHSTASTQATGFQRGIGGAGGFGEGGFPGGAAGGTGGQDGAGRGFGGFTTGTIVSVSGNTVVLKEANGTQVTVTTSGTTSVTKSSKASVSDLAAGDTIRVIGTTDSSGNVTATTITEGDLTALPGGARAGGNG